jgi:conjugative relaxase-like TrwC/TraI family protein
MLKVTPISDIPYLTESASDASTAVAYYTDTKSEPPGVWWCPGNWIVKDASRAIALLVTRLSQGRHPTTGRQIVRGRGNKRRAAIDLTFSAPKHWTALWVVSDPQGRVFLDEMLIAAVRESLAEVLATGLIEARIGKGGIIREPMKGLVAALYRHRTSREGDPQAHIHAALLNVGKRKDGQIRAINNEKLCEVHKIIGAAFRLRLAEKLEACGVPVRADPEHGFVIDGQPAELADIWSKRRKQIVNAAGKAGLANTAGKLKQIDWIVKRTRGKKTGLPSIEVLEARWREEALAAGWLPQAEWSRLDRPAITRTVDQDAGGAAAVVREAIANITEKHSIFYRREVEAIALTLAVGHTSAAAVRRAVDLVLSGPEIVDLHRDGMLTTQLIVEQEQEIVQIARQRQNELAAGFSPAARQMVLAAAQCSDEQRDVISHALAAHGVSVIEGGENVGETTAAAALKAACLQDGRRLILVAPSSRAAETLRNELAYDGPAPTLDKLLLDLRVDKMALQHGDAVFVDAAGVIGARQMLALMRVAQQVGAKLILQGATNKMAVVNRGDPLALIGRAVGNQQIRTFRRQKIVWQREASMLAQQGEIGQALAVYADQNAVNIALDQKGTLVAMARAFMQAKGDAVAIAATNAQVAVLNALLRAAARKIGIISEQEIVILAVSCGRKGSKAKPVELALAEGDRLILGGEAVIGGVTLCNATRLTVKAILPGARKILLESVNGQVLMTSATALTLAGKGGRPVVMQHAYAVTAREARRVTWSRTLWLALHEDSRSALVAMTRHRDDLTVFVDLSTLRNYGGVTMNVSRAGVAAPEQLEDDHSDMEIVAAIGRSMERVTAPRNALDILGLAGRATMSASPPLPMLVLSGADGEMPRDTVPAAHQPLQRNLVAEKVAMRRQAAAHVAWKSSGQPDMIEELPPEPS